MTPDQNSLLCDVARSLESGELKKFTTVRELYRSIHQAAASTNVRERFERLFCDFYKVSSRYVSDDFKRRYFELLFSPELPDGDDGYRFALKALLPYKRRNGRQALECSFVSKLIATRDETRPLFDTHVANFFGIFVPRTGSPDFRINQWLKNLDAIKQTYAQWVSRPDFHATIQGLKEQHPTLEDVPDARLCDLLVWTVGKKSFGRSPK